VGVRVLCEMSACRVCLDAGLVENLICPCACRGSSELVHRTCLDLWRSTRNSRVRESFVQCSVCLSEYKFGRTDVTPRSRRRIAARIAGKGVLGLAMVQLWLLAASASLAAVNVEPLAPVLRASCGLSDAAASSFVDKFLRCWPTYYTVALVSSLAGLGVLGLVVACCEARSTRRTLGPGYEDADVFAGAFWPDCFAVEGDGDAAVVCCALGATLLVMLGVFFAVACVVVSVQDAWQRKVRRQGLKELCAAYPVLDLPTSSAEQLDPGLQERLREELRERLACAA
jgi:hypothetical protein